MPSAEVGHTGLETEKRRTVLYEMRWMMKRGEGDGLKRNIQMNCTATKVLKASTDVHAQAKQKENIWPVTRNKSLCETDDSMRVSINSAKGRPAAWLYTEAPHLPEPNDLNSSMWQVTPLDKPNVSICVAP
ncbi:hypothetical protein AC579_502 [Pseudocercospora musae]|uniref:Uncharacterized protein n=1 Tax=Pseudocercospora musae TaxID=113226 RepID=A0A139I625_9PEZI|nr:hypothetical protein AC579_502 [Pseudocercospora musae]